MENNLIKEAQLEIDNLLEEITTLVKNKAYSIIDKYETDKKDEEFTDSEAIDITKEIKTMCTRIIKQYVSNKKIIDYVFDIYVRPSRDKKSLILTDHLAVETEKSKKISS